MSNDFQKLKPWIDAVNSRGVSGIYARNGFEDGKDVSERLQVSNWRVAVEESRNSEITSVSKNEDDPPDFFVVVKGRKTGVEVTELVNADLLSRNEADPKNALSAYHGEGFRMTQWTEEKFRAQLADRISKKGKKYDRQNRFVDVLAIMCDEPWLYEDDVCNWLNGAAYPRHESIGAKSTWC